MIDGAARRGRSAVPSLLNNKVDPNKVLGGRVIASNEERSRRQAALDGLLGRDGERFDKLA